MLITQYNPVLNLIKSNNTLQNKKINNVKSFSSTPNCSLSSEQSLAIRNSALARINFKSNTSSCELAEGLINLVNKDQKRKNPVFLRVDPRFIEKMVKNIENNPEKPIFVRMTGKSNSGKTTILDTIKEVVGDDKITEISGDDYYKDFSEIPEDKYNKDFSDPNSVEHKSQYLVEHGYSFDEPSCIDMEQMCKDLKVLAQGKEVYIPKHIFPSVETIPACQLKKPEKIILLEGIFSLNPKINESLKDCLDIGIYVDAPQDVIKERWYVKSAKRGVVGKAADIQYNDVETKAKEHIEPCCDTADIVINGQADLKDVKATVNDLCNLVSKTQKVYSNSHS